MNMVAELLGSMTAKVADPVTWVVMVLAIAGAVTRRAWWLALVAAGVGAIVVTILVSQNSAMIAVPFNGAQVWFSQMVLIGAWSQISYWLVRVALPGRG